MASLPPELKSESAYYTFLGVGAGERKFLEKHAFYRYSVAHIPKRRGGSRTLLVPERRLKHLQRKTLGLLEKIYSARVTVHGFVKGRGVISNADKHQTRPYLLNLDLKNYFGVISRARVSGMLVALGLSEEVASAICDICVTRNQLPQGAPTSPILSNLVSYSLDRDLMRFAKEHRLRYTRYADDISLSSYVQPTVLFESGVSLLGRVTVEQLSQPLRTVIRSNGFEINPEKTWFSGPNGRKEVTGLIVNEFVNVKRSFVRNLRAALYKAEIMGISPAEKDYHARYKTNAALEQILRGRLEWLAQVRGRSFSAYRTLAKRFNALYPKSLLPILPTYEEIAERSVWVIEFFKGTECEQGTAFFLEGTGLVSCHHVFEALPAGAYADLYRPSAPGKKFKAKLTKHCDHRDLAMLDHDVPPADYLHLPITNSPSHTKDEILALGFPNFSTGDQLSQRSGRIVAHATKHAVKKIEVSAVLTSGISGGPIVNDRYQVVAIAQRGGYSEGKQIAIDVSEIVKLASE